MIGFEITANQKENLKMTTKNKNKRCYNKHNTGIVVS